MKKPYYLTLAAMILCAVMLLCGCDAGGTVTDGTTEGETTTDATVTTEPEAISELVIPTDGSSDYILVRSEDSGTDITAAMAMINTKYCGGNFKLKTDFESWNDKPEDRYKYEILVGITNRTESVETYKTLKTLDYAVKLIGEKIVIIGGSDAATLNAVDYFISHCISDGKITVNAENSYSYTGKYEVSSMTIGGKPVTDYAVIYYTDANSVNKYLAEQFCYAVAEVSGFNLSVYSKSAAPENTPYITVGKQVATQLLIDEYSITVTDGAMALEAGSVIGVAGLIRYFKETLVNTPDAIIAAGITHKAKSVESVPLTAGSDLRIMTNNVYGDYTGELASLNIKQRYAVLAEYYLKFMPDFICLQEAKPTVHSMLIPLLSQVYSVINTGTENSQHQVPILYDKSKYTVVEWNQFIYSTYSMTKQPSKAVTWGVFKSITTGKTVIIINNHLSVGVEGVQYGATELRRQNAVELMLATDMLMKKYPGVPMLITGDFNTGENTTPYNVITEKGFVNARMVSKGAKGAYHVTFHNWAGGKAEGSPIDHVFLTPDTVEVLFHGYITDDDMVLATDHYPVYADVALK